MLRKTFASFRLSPAATLAAAAAACVAIAAAGFSSAASQPANEVSFPDATGVVTTLTTAGSFDTSNPFFQVLGTNGRSCSTCHRAARGWTITPAETQARFALTAGLDPLFRNNDGSNCEGADVSTLAAREANFSLLLNKALIRVGRDVPSNAEFDIVSVDDPYKCGPVLPDGTPLSQASMYRRPLPATNLRFLSTVMWDGRETVPGQAITDDLATQALDATTGHAQGQPPLPATLQQIVDFETKLFTAQSFDTKAGALDGRGALGGPESLSTQTFCIGINDPLMITPPSTTIGGCPTPSSGLNTAVFTIFDAWASAVLPARQAIARGQQIFNTRQFVIDNVPGLNAANGSGPVLGAINGGTCTVCHDTPNVGDHSVSMALNIGVSDASRRTPDLPLYTLRNKTTLETVQTTDPGRAMITGKWADVGKFKGPVLRGLAARAPYFHNGSAATLADVVDFYNTRFNIGLTAQEKSDLIAFLNAL